MNTLKERTRQLLKSIDIEIDGSRPFDLQIKDDRAYARFWGDGTIGAGESYMDGWWDVEDLSALSTKLLSADLYYQLLDLSTAWYFLGARFANMQNRSRSTEVAKIHYDIGNDLYSKMLDKRMIYSCGYWSSPTNPAKDLDGAQEQKLDLICRKVGLKKGDHILDIGCGWGGFLKFAAEKYGVSGVGITLSQEQAALARKECAGLPIEIRVEDYRDTTGQYDHIISIGMFEHVGPKNYRAYFKKINALLKDDGLFLLHTIGSDRTTMSSDPWFDKYIFPGGVLPSVEQIGKATDLLFILEDWHNFGVDYDKTLQAWWQNFDRAWPELKEKYGERFYRMWKYYLLSVAGVFRARRTELWHVVLSKKGVPGGYQSVR